MDTETIQTEQAAEINRGYLHHIRAWSGARAHSRWKALKDRLFFGNELRIVLLPFLLLAALVLLLALRWSTRRGARTMHSPAHERALQYVGTFIQQYPLHLYPIVTKALELGYLKDRLSTAVRQSSRILEVAVGEGTLSARLFADSGRQVTAVDLNPYSLVKASTLPHVRRAIVGDGMNPPLRLGSFDLLLSVNFMHHVSQKESVIANWARLAGVLSFNENTPFWASGWAVPYLLRWLGLRTVAARRARAIALLSLQHLEDIATLEQHIQRSCDVLECTSFMSERTFFLASIFSFFMRCYGPPTPLLLKRWSLGFLRPLVLPLTEALARRLVEFDATQDRSRDSVVMFLCRSRNWRREEAGNDLVCPSCRADLDAADRCTECGFCYPRRDGMLFLLPQELRFIGSEFRSDTAQSMPAEHL